MFKNRRPDEYKDEVQFFQKTYLTEELKSLLALVEKRLQGTGGSFSLVRREICLRFVIPKGNVAGTMGVINFTLGGERQ